MASHVVILVLYPRCPGVPSSPALVVLSLTQREEREHHYVLGEEVLPGVTQCSRSDSALRDTSDVLDPTTRSSYTGSVVALYDHG